MFTTALDIYVSSNVLEGQSPCLHSIAFLQITVRLWPVVNNANDFYDFVLARRKRMLSETSFRRQFLIPSRCFEVTWVLCFCKGKR